MAILEVVSEDDLMIITDKGTMIRQKIENINVIGRNTQGVRLINLNEGANIASVTKVVKDQNKDEETLEETENNTEPKE